MNKIDSKAVSKHKIILNSLAVVGCIINFLVGVVFIPIGVLGSLAYGVDVLAPVYYFILPTVTILLVVIIRRYVKNIKFQVILSYILLIALVFYGLWPIIAITIFIILPIAMI